MNEAGTSMSESTGSTILLVEDDPRARESTQLFLEDEGFEVVTAGDGAEALRRLSEGVAVVVTDLKMPKVDGMQLLRTARENAPHTPVIMITGHGSEAAAVAALKAGAFHYLTKPFEPEVLASMLRQALMQHKTAIELVALRQKLKTRAEFQNMIGKSEAMRNVFEQVRMVADTHSIVLIQGDSGTGKELVAIALHEGSSRSDKPFLAINCAALPETLVESELFGHAKGAFTGAAAKRTGKFAAADGGSLLIDEIGDMPLHLQPKLLRAIETGRITPLGSNEEIKTDVRIIASTHQDLQELMKQGKFREDLFYRLNVVRIELPPLRERREDIPLLVRSFIDAIASENHRPARDISPEALAALQSYDWPGNVRELRNVLERVVVMSTRETIEVADLPAPIRQAEYAPPLQSLISVGMSLADLEKEAIRQTLERTGGDREQASTILGVSVRTLQRRITKYGWSP